jgi:hypothetical protein
MDRKLTTAPMELDALLLAITAAVEALLLWDVDSFREAAGQQRAICERLSSCGRLPLSTEIVRKARQIRELNLIYGRLLQHSIHWTKTLQAIGGGAACRQARRLVDIRG